MTATKTVSSSRTHSVSRNVNTTGKPAVKVNATTPKTSATNTVTRTHTTVQKHVETYRITEQTKLSGTNPVRAVVGSTSTKSNAGNTPGAVKSNPMSKAPALKSAANKTTPAKAAVVKASK